MIPDLLLKVIKMKIKYIRFKVHTCMNKNKNKNKKKSNNIIK